MNKFICIIYKDASRGKDLLEKAKQWLPMESPFHISALDAYHFKNKGIIIASAKSSTSVFTNLSYISADSDNALVFDGAPFYMAYDPTRDWHEQIRGQIMAKMLRMFSRASSVIIALSDTRQASLQLSPISSEPAPYSIWSRTESSRFRTANGSYSAS